MIKFENTDVYGFDAAIRGMRNSMNSWEKSDTHEDGFGSMCIGQHDFDLMMKLVKAGPDNSKFLRMVNLTVDITAPLYWWKEFDTYKVGTVRNSCSTMHTIHKREFVLDDFSHDHMEQDFIEFFNNYIIGMLNHFRDVYVNFDEYQKNGKLREGADKKTVWWHIIQLLPSSYNQRATVQMNYAVLRNMYHARKNHKLDEWRIGFCGWVRSLPCSELITE